MHSGLFFSFLNAAVMITKNKFYVCKLFLNLEFTLHSCYKDYLSVDFPFGSYKQIFIEPEIVVSSASLGVSMCIFSSHLLFDEKIIDQVCLFIWFVWHGFNNSFVLESISVVGERSVSYIYMLRS